MLTKDDFLQIRQVLHEVIHEEVYREFKQVREDIKTVDIKVELVNKKVDSLYEATVDGLGKVIDTMDEMNDGVVERVSVLEKHVGIPHH